MKLNLVCPCSLCSRGKTHSVHSLLPRNVQISLLDLIMAVGFAVDYSAHIGEQLVGLAMMRGSRGAHSPTHLGL